MRLLRIAVQNQRWDLVAHTIVLATASVLKNGDKPHNGKKVSNIHHSELLAIPAPRK